MASTNFSSMSTTDLVLWLKDQGIPDDFCDKFEGA